MAFNLSCVAWRDGSRLLKLLIAAYVEATHLFIERTSLKWICRYLLLETCVRACLATNSSPCGGFVETIYLVTCFLRDRYFRRVYDGAV